MNQSKTKNRGANKPTEQKEQNHWENSARFKWLSKDYVGNCSWPPLVAENNSGKILKEMCLIWSTGCIYSSVSQINDTKKIIHILKHKD